MTLTKRKFSVLDHEPYTGKYNYNSNLKLQLNRCFGNSMHDRCCMYSKYISNKFFFLPGNFD